ncbi:MAG: hypothetical protein WA108_12235 [Thiobacillus sp.]
MFPLVLILAAGLFPFDRRVVRYALRAGAGRLAVGGFPLGGGQRNRAGARHAMQPGVPCSVDLISWFGFLTLPLLSVLAFSTIIALLVLTRFKASK